MEDGHLESHLEIQVVSSGKLCQGSFATDQLNPPGRQLFDSSLSRVKQANKAFTLANKACEFPGVAGGG